MGEASYDEDRGIESYISEMEGVHGRSQTTRSEKGISEQLLAGAVRRMND